MNLKQAIGVAKNYVAKEGPEACVRLRSGSVVASTGLAGVIVPVETLEIEPISVDCASLDRLLRAASGDAVISIGSGRKLVVRDGRSRTTLQAIPDTYVSEPPVAPEASRWQELTEAQLRVVTAVASLVDGDVRGNPALAGLRCGPGWVAAVANAYVVVGWVAVGSASLTVPPSAFARMKGAGGVLVDSASVWVRDALGIRWARALQGEFPDKSVMDMVARSRENPATPIDIAPLEDMLSRAGAAAETRADPFKLRLTSAPAELTLFGGDPSRSHGAVEFEGRVELKAAADTGPVGVYPATLAKLLAAVDSEKGTITIGRGNDPIALTGGDPVIEALMSPAYLVPER